MTQAARVIAPAAKEAAHGMLLQRRCACGAKAPTAGAECDECKGAGIGMQARLTVSTPGDAFEREADAVAARALQMPSPVQKNKAPLSIQRLGTGSGNAGRAAPPVVEQADLRLLLAEDGRTGTLRLSSSDTSKAPEPVDLSSRDGHVLMVRGVRRDDWIYSAVIVEEAGPLVALIAQASLGHKVRFPRG